MKSDVKIIGVACLGVTIIAVLYVFLWERTRKRITNEAGSLQPKSVLGLQFSGRYIKNNVRLRFDPRKHPHFSSDSRDYYYNTYKTLLFPKEQDPFSTDRRLIANLKAGRDLSRTLGEIGRLEVAEALPFLIDLLGRSEDPSVLRTAAKLLAQFGNGAGVDFLIREYNNETLAPKKLLFDIITRYQLREYIPKMREILADEQKKGGSHGYYAARILAYFGDPFVVNYYLSELERIDRNFDDEDLGLLGNVNDSKLVAPLMKQFEISDRNRVKTAAAHALARQGMHEYEEFVIERALMGLTIPDLRADERAFQVWVNEHDGEDGSGIAKAVSCLSGLKSEGAARALESLAKERARYAQRAVAGLAKMATRSSRDALLRLAEMENGRESTDGVYLGNYLARALSLFRDSESEEAAISLFDMDKSKNLTFFLAESKGYDGLFTEKIKRW